MGMKLLSLVYVSATEVELFWSSKLLYRYTNIFNLIYVKCLSVINYFPVSYCEAGLKPTVLYNAL